MPPSPPRLRLRLTAAAETAVRSGHPWVYSDKIREKNREGEAGELAVIYDREDRFLAIGLYDPGSPLVVRILHRGKPVTLDAAWWRERLRAAAALRAPYFGPDTDGYRLVNGESDGFPGLVLDRYAGCLVLKLYSSAWFPALTSVSHPPPSGGASSASPSGSPSSSLAGQASPRANLPPAAGHSTSSGGVSSASPPGSPPPALAGLALIPLLQELFAPERIVLRLSRNVDVAARLAGLSDGQNLLGDDTTPSVVFHECGLRFESDVVQGQKTGFYLDQRENRRRIGSMARGCDVLNVFSFSGGFSVHAAHGGARSVTDLDISPHALASARRNFALNIVDPRNGPEATVQKTADDADGRRCRNEGHANPGAIDLTRGVRSSSSATHSESAPSAPSAVSGAVSGISAAVHHQVQGDAFAWLERAGGDQTFDIVILDPPSMAKRESERAGAIEAYRRLAALGIGRVRRGGLLLAASCSAHVTEGEFFGAVRHALRSAGRPWRELETTGHAPDHPATFPEARYLKALYARLD